MVTVSSQCQAITDRYQRGQSQAERGHVTCRNRSLVQGNTYQKSLHSTLFYLQELVIYTLY